MTTDKEKRNAVPATVPRDEFTRILGNLASSPPEKRTEIRAGGKKRQGKMIQPKPDSDQR
jgi:hypothetical protein